LQLGKSEGPLVDDAIGVMLGGMPHIHPERLGAAGGIATMDDLRELAARGIDGAVIGRALYEGGINLTEALGEFPG